ncbi:MAG: LCP family protein [Patescibacteria group bacterium]|nr:LCP family protein [Patescibacteria group bacterium]
MIDFKQKIEKEERYRYPLEEEPQPNKKTKRLFIYLGIFGVIALLFAGKILVSSKSSSEWFKNTFFSGLSHLVINPSTQLKGEENDRINILLLGMGGANHEGGNLTDTIILLSLKPSTKQASMISIPRDMVAPDKNGNWRKVNSVNAYAEKEEEGSGGKAICDTLSTLLDEPIPYYIRADFQGFINIIDEVGGVDIYVENTFDDYTYPISGREDAADYYSRFQHLHFDKGWQKMDGATALKYARSRHSLGVEGSDFARAKRQQIVLEAAKDKVLSRNTLTNPATLTKIIGQLESHIGTNLQISEMIKLWNMFKDVQKAQITNKVLDNSVSGLLMDSRGDGGAYILLPRGNSFKPIRDMIDTIFGDILQASSSSSDISVPKMANSETIKIKKIKESATIEILNGTWISGIASKASTNLEEAGFTVLKLGNSQERNYTRNTIYDLTYGTKKEALEALKTAYNAEVSFSWPLWLEEKISAYEDEVASSTENISTSTEIIDEDSTEISNEENIASSTAASSTPSKTNSIINPGPDFILILGDKNNTAAK